MDFNFDRITIYCIKNEKLFLIPKGELKQFNVDIDIDPILIMDLPTTLEELKNNIEKCFSLCWSSFEEKLTNEPSQIEKALRVKSYKKVVEKCDIYVFTFYKNKKNYTFNKLMKAKNFRCYEGAEYIKTWDEIDYDFILNEIQDPVS